MDKYTVTWPHFCIDNEVVVEAVDHYYARRIASQELLKKKEGDIFFDNLTVTRCTNSASAIKQGPKERNLIADPEQGRVVEI